jgi:glutathione peroxidase
MGMGQAGDLTHPGSGQHLAMGGGDMAKIASTLMVFVALLLMVTAPTQTFSQSAAKSGGAASLSFPGLTGGTVRLADYRGKVLMVVNTASKCGYTPQYEGLQRLYDRFRTRGLVVIGVPSGDFGAQELGSSKEIASFCKLNYGVSFPMTTKQTVTGAKAHPFFVSARARLGAKAVPRWNFHKIIVGRNGVPIAAFPSATDPNSPELVRVIENAMR